MQSYIQGLKSEDALVRNDTAIKIIDGNHGELVPKLLGRINDPKTKGANGTLVYALGHFDCSEYFTDLVRFAVTLGYDAHFGAMCILGEQKFWINEEDIKQIKDLFDSLDDAALKEYHKEAIRIISESFL